MTTPRRRWPWITSLVVGGLVLVGCVPNTVNPTESGSTGTVPPPATVTVPGSAMPISSLVAPPSTTSVPVAPTTTPAAPPPATTSHALAAAPETTTCGDDTYVNSDGHCVPRPTKAATAPPGATARCKDGTYSFSEHRRGTCSGHGGVAAWL